MTDIPVKMANTMLLLEKGKKPQMRCAECTGLFVPKGQRQRRVGGLCRTCKEVLVNEAVDKYKALVRTGLPPARRWVETRIDLLRYYDKEWDEMLVAAITSVPEPQRQLRPLTVRDLKRNTG